jgi:hypothetical protein
MNTPKPMFVREVARIDDPRFVGQSGLAPRFASWTFVVLRCKQINWSARILYSQAISLNALTAWASVMSLTSRLSASRFSARPAIGRPYKAIWVFVDHNHPTGSRQSGLTGISAVGSSGTAG